MKKAVNGTRLASISTTVFRRWKLMGIIWLCLLIAGGLIYSRVINREGFPTVQFPLAVISGPHFVDDPAQVDSDITQPLSTFLNGLDEVDQTESQSLDNYFSTTVYFKEGVDAVSTVEYIEQNVASGLLPKAGQLNYTVIDPSGFLGEFDMLLSVYSPSKNDAKPQDLTNAANQIADILEDDGRFTNVAVQSPVESVIDDEGQVSSRQTSFGLIGFIQNGQFNQYSSVTIGLDSNDPNLDVLELREAINNLIQDGSLSPEDGLYQTRIAASFAETVSNQIDLLESNLTTGLIAVALVSLLLITWRASVITTIFMITVMAVSVLVLYILGYTLNTITLFGLVLSLGLFVDDATIVVEALDANRKKKRKAIETVRIAVSKVASASMAGTFTTVLVFAPLMFVSGVLGEFIRLLPVTVIIALVSSLVLSLTLIPLLSRFILLSESRSHRLHLNNPLAKLEKMGAKRLRNNILLLRQRSLRGKLLAAIMVSLSLGLIAAGMHYQTKLSNNIFPSSSDSNKINLTLRYPQDFSIVDAENLAAEVAASINKVGGDNVTQIAYGALFDRPTATLADAVIDLKPFTERDVKAPDLVRQLDEKINQTLPKGAVARFNQADVGPPEEDYPFKVQVYADSRQSISDLAEEIEAYLGSLTLKRDDGTEAQITATRISGQTNVIRNNAKMTMVVEAGFDGQDTSDLLVLAEDLVSQEFNETNLASRGYEQASLGFNFGWESDNSESFASLAVVFPIALSLMFILLAAQFRSLLQPLLIFMAIPFTFFGVYAGLYFTNHDFSFFTQVGLIGLVGIAVNNTILMTDYANQQRRNGLKAVEAVAEATKERFRPLLTTSLTTVVALLPLALTDPFWEALSFTIIFGLLSSTLLVMLAFPYYYLGAEWLRGKVSFRKRRAL